MVKYKKIDHIALHVKDIIVSKRFYQSNFGFNDHYEQITPTGVKISYLKLGDTTLELVERQDPNSGGFHWCIETDDFNGAVAQLKHSQVELIQAPHPTEAREKREEGWHRAVFKGPDGEQIEIRG